MANCLFGPSCVLQRRSFQGLPIPVQRASTHAQGLKLRGVHERLAMGVVHDVAFPLSEQGRQAEHLISELNGWPACAPVNASPAMLPPPAHDSGLERFATPFLRGSFIRDSLPVYPGAFTYPLSVTPCCERANFSDSLLDLTLHRNCVKFDTSTLATPVMKSVSGTPPRHRTSPTLSPVFSFQLRRVRVWCCSAWPQLRPLTFCSRPHAAWAASQKTRRKMSDLR